VGSGQVFRWELLQDESWLGVDGDYWYVVTPGKVSLHVESNASASEFEALFRLDWNSEEIERELLEKSPELAPYFEAIDGLRLMKPSCSTETFFNFLCTPNNNLTRILKMSRHLASYGPVLAEVRGMTLYRFPDVEGIARIPEAELRAKAFGYRAATIPAIAGQVLERGVGWIESLKSVSYHDAHAELIRLKGIGPKLADCIALFALHHTEAVPIDTHIWQAYTRLYRPDLKDNPMTDSRYREAADFMRHRYGKLGGWAQQYLFYDNMMNWRERGRCG